MDLSKLRTLLGLADDADEAAIMAELEKRLAPASEGDEEDKDKPPPPPPEDDEEYAAARHSPTERLLLKRIDDLEKRIAAQDERETEARVERDIAAGRVPTADRAEYTELARKDPDLYARLTAGKRAVPTGRVAKPSEARKTSAPNGRIDLSELSESDSFLVATMRAAGTSEDRIRAALARRGEV